MAELEWLTYDDFAGREGESFDVVLADARVRLELVEVTESDQAGGVGPAGEQRTQFSVVFRGPGARLLPQGSYALAHAGGLGELVLFLVPVGSAADGVRYEAAFA